jgi:hydrogenase maturation factor
MQRHCQVAGREKSDGQPLVVHDGQVADTQGNHLGGHHRHVIVRRDGRGVALTRPEVRAGDCVVTHAGTVLTILTREEAAEMADAVAELEATALIHRNRWALACLSVRLS